MHDSYWLFMDTSNFIGRKKGYSDVSLKSLVSWCNVLCLLLENSAKKVYLWLPIPSLYSSLRTLSLFTTKAHSYVQNPCYVSFEVLLASSLTPHMEDKELSRHWLRKQQHMCRKPMWLFLLLLISGWFNKVWTQKMSSIILHTQYKFIYVLTKTQHFTVNSNHWWLLPTVSTKQASPSIFIQ